MKEVKDIEAIDNRNSLYLPNLNGVRFIAAFMVFIHHLEFTKKELNLPNIWTKNGLGFIGDLGVTLFFTLSGFLITYLLLLEKEKTSTINIKAFYTRRILRIWPLYYLVVLISLFLLPQIRFFDLSDTNLIQDNFKLKLAFFLFMLPNVVFSFFPRIPYAVQTWSIGVEEQFYLVWPFIIKYSKRIILTLFIIYFVFLTLNEIAIFYKLFYERTGQLDKTGQLEKWGHLMVHFKIGCMSAGGLSAGIYFFYQDFALRFINLKVQIILLTISIILCFYSNDFVKNHEVLSLFFSLLILNFAFAKKVIFNLEIHPLKYLGKISYGLYMYQFIAITIAIKSNVFFNEIELFWSNVYYYTVAFVLTVLFSILSYEFFEKRFIGLKKKFQIVKSIN